MRKMIVRSKFEVEHELPPDIILKQAETEDEIQQALRLVHDSYVELNYMDPNEPGLRFSKFHALPTTVILIAKWKDDVIGTLTIIPDSALGLPSDTTWSLEKYRKDGKIIAEISSLCIKKDFRMRRGRLLMPLCKIMYLYCKQVLKLDGIVIATTLEVEPFYTDILLFETVVEKTGQKHMLVKGNPSSCCYLALDDNLRKNYQRTYGKKPLSKNLYHFFLDSETPNIQLPKPKHCIQSYMIEKNSSKARLLNTHRSLLKDFSDVDKLIIKGLDASNSLSSISLNTDLPNQHRRSPRPEIRAEGWCFFSNGMPPARCIVMDVSRTGFKIALRQANGQIHSGERFVLALNFNGTMIQCQAEVKWNQSQTKMGCQVVETSPSWNQLIAEVLSEISSHEQTNLAPLPQRKTA